eukprot:TRINITY_DN89764_c0_g1_i1.p1 TRINITY_DN89764_c0_g1~~TRINITY_DN89764_c0_g1_i1.p1  ORF type:complete len:711 (-),score=89.28 TRINITY_DN89764_c0_g1_i1:39-2171(-)
MSMFCSHPWFRRLLLPLDARAIALFRISLGFVALWQWWDAVEHRWIRLIHGECAGLPGDECKNELQAHGFSIYHGAEAWRPVLLLLAVHLGAVCCFILGWWSQLSAALLWMFAYSVECRFGHTYGAGGHDVMRHLVFWSCFLPLGARYSLDAAFANSADRARSPNVSVVLAIVLQISYIYYSSGFAKEKSLYWSNGLATWKVLQLPNFIRKGPASVLVEFKSFCKLLSYASIKLEQYGWICLFVPLERVRTFTVAAFLSFHLGIGLTMTVGPFVVVMLSAWLVFVPSSACDVIEDALVVPCRSLLTAFQRSCNVASERLRKHAQRLVTLIGTVVGHILPLVVIYAIGGNICRRLESFSDQPCYPMEIPGVLDEWVLSTLGLRQAYYMFARPEELTDDTFMIAGLAAPSAESPRKEWRVVSLWEDGELNFAGRDFNMTTDPLSGLGSGAKAKSHTWTVWFDQLKIEYEGIPRTGKFMCNAWGKAPGWGNPPANVQTLLGFTVIKAVSHWDFKEEQFLPHRLQQVFHHTCHGIADKEMQTGDYLSPAFGDKLVQAEVLFDNPTNEVVDIFWVDTKGNEEYKFSLEAGKKFTQMTQFGHLFHARQRGAAMTDKPQSVWRVDTNNRRFKVSARVLTILLINYATEPVEIRWERPGIDRGLQGVLQPAQQLSIITSVGTIFTYQYSNGLEAFTVKPDTLRIVGFGIASAARAEEL